MPPEDRPSDRGWVIDERGPFLVGRCTRCGYVGPARRASFSVEADLHTHEVLCLAAGLGGTGSGADEGWAPDRERLSAQGRS